MNKDKVVASAIGFTLGIVAAIILWKSPQLFSKKSTTAPDFATPETAENATPLTLNAPTDGSIIVASEIIKVEGKAESTHMIVVTSPIDETVTVVDENDSFAVSLELEMGDNDIVVTEYDTKGIVVNSQQVNVTYTDKEL